MIHRNRLLVGIISVGIIIGVLYGLSQAITYVSENNYFQYGLNNIGLNIFQESLNKYVLIFSILTFLFIFLPAALISWIKSNCIDFKVINTKNLRILLYSFFATIFAAALYYIYYDRILTFLESNSFFSATTNSIGIGISIISIVMLALIIVVIVLFSTVIFSRINILSPFQNLIYRALYSKIIMVFAGTLLLVLVLFNVGLYGYQKLKFVEGPNIVLISIDTLRADHLGAYGYGRNTSPNIDRLANEGILFENAFSQAPWTLPAMSSIHTSLYPAQHGVIDYDRLIDNKYITLAEFLKNYHYKTIGVISMPFVDSKYGFSQGFDIFNEKYISGLKDITSDLITIEAIKYLDQHKNDKFFLWIHYFDPHGSYVNHKEIEFASKTKKKMPNTVDPGALSLISDNLSDEDIQYIKDLYDEEIAFTDKHIGNLLDKIDTLGLKENTIVILTSDHGEEFLERGGFGHRKLLYNELIKVPLIVYNPIYKNQKGLISMENVETRSIAKTIVDIIEIDSNPFSGQNLISENKSKDKKYVFSNVYKKGNILKESVISDNLKLIKNNSDEEKYELYDFYSDKKEKNNIFGISETTSSTLQSDLLSKLSELPGSNIKDTKEVDLNSEDIKKLKALGYLQ